MTHFECKPVPREYIGLWRRDGIEVDGEWDTNTRVFWLQTGTLYADIRVPSNRPSFEGVHSLEACSPEQLRWLAGQEGFAGCLHVEGETCRWERVFDYQPPGMPDIGRMTFHADDTVTEYGVLAEYREEWRRIDGATRRMAVILDGNRPGLLVTAGDWFLAAFGRENPLSVPSLQEVLGAVEPHRAAALLECELSLGRIRDGAEPWEITLSTLPFREGESLLLDVESAGARFEACRPDGSQVTGDIVECTADFQW